MSAASARALVQEKLGGDISQKHVLVFSKTWCGFCTRVKGLFKDLKVDAGIIELDTVKGGDAIHAELKKITGQSSVPNIFIGDKHIGGCDDTFALHKQGKLQAMLK